MGDEEGMGDEGGGLGVADGVPGGGVPGVFAGDRPGCGVPGEATPGAVEDGSVRDGGGEFAGRGVWGAVGETAWDRAGCVVTKGCHCPNTKMAIATRMVMPPYLIGLSPIRLSPTRLNLTRLSHWFIVPFPYSIRADGQYELICSTYL